MRTDLTTLGLLSSRAKRSNRHHLGHGDCFARDDGGAMLDTFRTEGDCHNS